MGASKSKTVADHPVSINKGVEESTRGGFHVLEVHMPTVGAGVGFIAVVLILACVAYAIYRKMRRRIQQRAAVGVRHPSLWSQAGDSAAFQRFPAVYFRAQQFPPPFPGAPTFPDTSDRFEELPPDVLST